MKILVVSPYFYCKEYCNKKLEIGINAKQFHDFYPEGGGLENYAYNISKGLVKKGFKVTVLCSTKEGKDKDEVIDGVRVIRQKPDFIVSNTPIKLNLYSTISDLLKKEKFDLVNAHTPVPYYADMACMAAKKQKVRFFLTYHNDNTHPNFFVNALCNVLNFATSA